MKPGLKYGLIVIVLIGLLGSAAAFLFLKDNSPEAVSLDAASDSVAGSDKSETSSDSAKEVEIAGKWAVDSDAGEFTFDSATGSFAGFRITEELAQIGTTEAVGRTGDVQGTLTIDGSTVTDATFTIDMTTLSSNDSRRNGKIQSALQTLGALNSTYRPFFKKAGPALAGLLFAGFASVPLAVLAGILKSPRPPYSPET